MSQRFVGRFHPIEPYTYGFLKGVKAIGEGGDMPDVFVSGAQFKRLFGHSSLRRLDGTPIKFSMRESRAHPGKMEAYALENGTDWHYPL